MSNRILCEVCVDSVEAAIAAQAGGADRVELCADLLEGGTTPSAATIQLTREHLKIDMNVIIRPRGGDFCYSDIEFETMRRDIQSAKAWGANGVVIGILEADGSVDTTRTQALVQAARPMSVTFHRAFDMTREPLTALEELISLGIDRVLTSGQEASVLEGLELITELVRRAGERMIVMPGGGINERNIRKIVEHSGVREVHFVAPASMESSMTYRNPRAFMGGELRPPEFALTVTDPQRVRQIVACLR